MAKRHRNRKVLRDNILGVTKPAIRRLCRRGGVKRLSDLIYEETRGVLKVFLQNIIRDAVTFTEHSRRKTITATDVVYALKNHGRTLYGFGDCIPIVKTSKRTMKPSDTNDNESPNLPNILFYCHCKKHEDFDDMTLQYKNNPNPVPVDQLEGVDFNFWYIDVRCHQQNNDPREFTGFQDFQRRKGSVLFDRIYSIGCPLSIQMFGDPSEPDGFNIWENLLSETVLNSLSPHGQILFFPHAMENNKLINSWKKEPIEVDIVKDNLIQLLHIHNRENDYMLLYEKIQDLDFYPYKQNRLRFNDTHIFIFEKKY